MDDDEERDDVSTMTFWMGFAGGTPLDMMGVDAGFPAALASRLIKTNYTIPLEGSKKKGKNEIKWRARMPGLEMDGEA